MKGIELVGVMGPAVPQWISGEASRLRQVLMNLVANAVKFTERGEVVLEVKSQEAGEFRRDAAGVYPELLRQAMVAAELSALSTIAVPTSGTGI